MELSVILPLFGVSAYISVYLFLNSKIVSPRRCNMKNAIGNSWTVIELLAILNENATECKRFLDFFFSFSPISIFKWGAWDRMDLHTTLPDQVPHRPGYCSDFYLELLSRELYLKENQNKPTNQNKQQEKVQESSHTCWMNYETFPVWWCLRQW